jgi:hypothetical protein
MGYIRHDAIIVTTWDAKRLGKARDKALELGLLATEIIEGVVNGYVSFLIAPDGSKEGWPESDAGDEARAAWKEWARTTDEMYVNWAHVNFGGDDAHLSSLADHSGAVAPPPEDNDKLRDAAQ